MNDGQYSSQVFSDKVAFGSLVDWTTRVYPLEATLMNEKMMIAVMHRQIATGVNHRNG
jgi:hypothetical protein